MSIEFPKMVHTPFVRDEKVPHKEGVYRSKKTGDIHLVRNVWIRSFVSDEKGPYRCYVADIKSTSPDIGNIKKCLLPDVDWEFIIPFRSN